MKSVFWLMCIALIVSVNCSPPKRAEVLPGTDSNSQTVAQTAKTGDSELVQEIAGTYVLKTGAFPAVLSSTSTISDVTLKLYQCGKFLIRYGSGDSDRKSSGGLLVDMRDKGWNMGAKTPETGSAAPGGPAKAPRGAWDATEKSRIQGTWHIEGTPQKGSIALTTRNGDTQIYVYQVKQKGWLYFNGTDFYRVASAKCK